MRVGLVGFTGSGKTTLFSALAGERASSGGGAGIGQIATVTLDRDPRLLWLVDLYRPKKVTPFVFQLLDYPGLDPADRSGAIRRIAAFRDEVEGLLLVVRGFPDPASPAGVEPRPARDARGLVSELLLADLELVNRRVEKLEVSVTKPTPKREEEKRELALLTRVRDALEEETPAKDLSLTPAEEKTLRGYQLLSAKPWVLLVSQPDEGEPDEAEGIPGPFEARLALRVRLESELVELPPEEREVFMEEMGVRELLLPGFLENLVSSVGMLRFYTVGEKEVHSWELARGATALDAAGAIHTDLARGFIRAEVVSYADLVAAGDMKGTRAAGTFRLEGRDYPVKDGDVITIRFSV